MSAAKAVLAGLIAFVGALVTASLTGGIGLHGWLAAVLTGLVALGGVYQVPNKPKPAAD